MQNSHFEIINIIPYNSETDDLINNYVWHHYMNNWLGYNPMILHEHVLKDNEEVKKMPSYPDDGSIKIIDGMIVIKN